MPNPARHYAQTSADVIGAAVARYAEALADTIDGEHALVSGARAPDRRLEAVISERLVCEHGGRIVRSKGGDRRAGDRRRDGQDPRAGPTRIGMDHGFVGRRHAPTLVYHNTTAGAGSLWNGGED